MPKPKAIKLENVRLGSVVLSYPLDGSGAAYLVVTAPLLCDLTQRSALALGIPEDQFLDDSRAKSVVLEAPPELMGLTFDPINDEKGSRSYHLVRASVHQATATRDTVKFSIAVKESAEAFCDWCKEYRGETYGLKMVAEQMELELMPDDGPQGLLPSTSPNQAA